ncbi:MAG: hypothetical protein ACYC6R_17330, partial [Anaerolineales bacterium]
CYNMHEGKSPLGKPRAYPVSLASGEPYLVRLSLFGFGLSELGIPLSNTQSYFTCLFIGKIAYGVQLSSRQLDLLLKSIFTISL